MTYFLSILLFFSFGQPYSTDNEIEQNNSLELIQTSQSLKTGWYYLTNNGNGIERKLNGTEETYFIDSNPIVTVANFTEMKIYQSKYGDYGLTIRLDDKGTEHWKEATGKSINQKLALIVDNELYFTPTIKSRIETGVTALNRGDLTEEELKTIKLKIEEEKDKKARP